MSRSKANKFRSGGKLFARNGKKKKRTKRRQSGGKSLRSSVIKFSKVFTKLRGHGSDIKYTLAELKFAAENFINRLAERKKEEKKERRRRRRRKKRNFQPSGQVERNKDSIEFLSPL